MLHTITFFRSITVLVSIYLCMYIFIYLGRLHWVSIAAHGLSLVAASGSYSSLQRAGFSSQWLLLLRSTGSRRVGFSSCGLWAPEHRLSSCGARAQLLHGMWDLPGPGLEPVSRTLASGFSTTVPPGKSELHTLNIPDNYDCKMIF